MDNYTFIINTFLGFVISLAWDVYNRDRNSVNSPIRFSLSFFFKDNKIRLLASLVLSLAMMLALWFNYNDVAELFGKQWEKLNKLAYFLIGLAPDLVVSFAKRKAGWLQPNEVKGFNRK